MVCRLLANHLSTSDTSVDRPFVTCRRSDRRLHAGSVDCCHPAGGGHVAICATLGGRSRGELGGAALGFCGNALVSRVFSGPVTHYPVRTVVFAGTSLLLSMVAFSIMALFAERTGTWAGSRFGASRYASVWICTVRRSGALAGRFRCAG